MVATRSSAPRPVGSKLIVRDDGSFEGSVSNGCVESDVMLAAQEVLAGGEPRLITYGITDEMAFGVGTAVRRRDRRVRRAVPRAQRRTSCSPSSPARASARSSTTRSSSRRRAVAAAVTCSSTRVARSSPTSASRRRASSSTAAIDTAEALCAAAKLLGWRTIVADARPRFATSERIPSADELLVLWPDEALAQVAPDAATAVVVLTHDDKFDLPLVRGALATEAFYLGWLGSRRNQERRRGLLLEEGVPEEDLDRISGPAGLDLGAASREETAVSILARDPRRARRPFRRAASRDEHSYPRVGSQHMLLREVEYAKPGSVAEALELLAANDGARALAGGQTLINVMKARAASPDMLVDLNGLEELRGIELAGDGTLTIGAMTTYSELMALGGGEGAADPRRGLRDDRRRPGAEPRHDRRQRLLERPDEPPAAADGRDRRAHDDRRPRAESARCRRRSSSSAST